MDPKTPEAEEELAIEPNPSAEADVQEVEMAIEPQANLEELAEAPVEGGAEIDGIKYSQEELEDIFNTGKTVKKYQTEHPGFDPLLIHRDYTVKTMELAELKKQFIQPTAPKKSLEEVAKELDVSPADIELVQKIAKSLGLVDRSEIQALERDSVAKSYESVKQEKVNEFVKKHAQFYHPTSKNGDDNWQKVLDGFSVYKMPEDPSKIATILERVHTDLFGGVATPAGKVLAQAKINELGRSAGGGGGAASSEVRKKENVGIPPVARKILKGFSEEDFQEMFGKN